MHMPRSMRPFFRSLPRYLFGLHILNGWVVAGGVLSAALISMAALGQQAGIVAMTGALCVSIADVPSPTRHKIWELGIAALLAAIASMLGGLASHNEVLLGVAVASLCFFSAMMTAYGRKALPNSFAPLLALFLTLGIHLPDSASVWRHSTLMLFGGALYWVYGVLAARLTERRMKRLAIGECLREFAGYLHEKARCYRTDVALPEQYRVLVTRQMALTERLQLARELVFRACRNDADARLVDVLRTLIDAVETILATHTDYEQLRNRHGRDDLLERLTGLAEAVADEVCALAFVLLRGRSHGDVPLSFEARVERIAQAMAQTAQPVDEEGKEIPRATMTLGVSFNKLRHGIAQVEALHRLLLDGPVAPLPSPDFLQAFTQHFSFSPKIFFAQLAWDSPVLRHAVRMSLAVTAGYILATMLPWGRHGNWIMLTVAVIMRAQFSLTRQRRKDRLLGNVFGCVIAAVLLHVLPAPAALAAVLVAVGAAHAFATVQYRIASTAACVMALLQLHFLAPGSGSFFMERVVDTALGTLIAYAFSYLLPYWENNFLPTQLKSLLAALAAFGGAKPCACPAMIVVIASAARRCSKRSRCSPAPCSAPAASRWQTR